ncbi:acyl-CoA thioesterase [Geoalkalibacter halelectricus]|uniref:Acyl-CoA thioesterase n=1 Tax=Geoalkalibacter halelectricus TaxID=2847045 RepID=A0ABY5ZGE6_9BACT|nr:acyl-CoA thioesterase [Geoalkalibacter halelectricus]MDO3380187.1 acyl-CoA thioesterase [Geoalkalibacter halelectricus]UWZ78240.1 acyl-CoA thioesterase [Geoalkalibacter halelectricus]
MNNYTIVRQEHLNHYGFLFGGAMLKWVDEFAWLVASRDFPGCPLVTVGMDRINFRQPVANGSILRFHILPVKQGASSITYAVHVFADEPGAREEKDVFSTTVTFVHVDAQGKKQSLPRSGTLRSQDGSV